MASCTHLLAPGSQVMISRARHLVRRSDQVATGRQDSALLLTNVPRGRHMAYCRSISSEDVLLNTLHFAKPRQLLNAQSQHRPELDVLHLRALVPAITPYVCFWTCATGGARWRFSGCVVAGPRRRACGFCRLYRGSLFPNLCLRHSRLHLPVFKVIS